VISNWQPMDLSLAGRANVSQRYATVESIGGNPPSKRARASEGGSESQSLIEESSEPMKVITQPADHDAAHCAETDV